LRVCPVTAIVGGQTRDSGKPEAFRGPILETLFGCRAYRLYSAKVVNGGFEPGFTMNLGLKNLGLAAAASQTLGRTLPCSMRVPARMAKAVRPGMGETVRRPSPTTPPHR
jgi:3-hydroxyisobutyrate dehydrogenase-like beta-hydroxyacid dehydrogenase